MLPPILASAIIVLVLLLIAELKDNFIGKLIFKPLLSTLFVTTACLQPWHLRGYAMCILAGLALSWMGDLFLIFKSQTMFLMGLVAFLLGHVCYTLGFFTLGTLNMWGMIGGVVMVAMGIAIFFWLRPHLGKMTGPVITYIMIISAMVSGALAISSTPGINIVAKRFILIGAILFYASDLFVARDQFIKTAFINRLMGLPLYFTAQFLLAVSVGTT